MAISPADTLRGLHYPWGPHAAPEPGEPFRVAEGVWWLRFPMPLSLDHINLWLLEDGGGWTIVDTCLDLAADCFANCFGHGGIELRLVVRFALFAGEEEVDHLLAARAPGDQRRGADASCYIISWVGFIGVFNDVKDEIVFAPPPWQGRTDAWQMRWS
jgi:hypothetical protein